MNYDLIVIGSGPGGYVAAIRASQLGMKTAIVEREHLGGVCLNWGCIPTKSLLKSAQVYGYASNAEKYGVKIDGAISVDYEAIVARSREIAENMNKGVQYLLKKNKIDVIWGTGKIESEGNVSVTGSDSTMTLLTASYIILATGARPREIENLPIDGKKIISYRQALSLPKLPKSMLVVGSGAIGSELAYFYQSIGTEVTLVECMPQIVPFEDEDISRQLERSFKKIGMKVLTKSTVENVKTSGKDCKVTIKTPKGIETQDVSIVFSAVGITPNIENIGLEKLKIKTEKGRLEVDERYQTNISGIYAIGDIINTPALAHVASAEGIACVEHIADKEPAPLNYSNIPGCIYTSPEVASVGLTEKAAKEAGYEIKTGKFPFTASGKAAAIGEKDGFVKLIFDEQYGELLGAHLIGQNVTEMISELVLAKNMDVAAHEIIKTIHPHPTMAEAIMEAAAAAYGEVIHM